MMVMVTETVMEMAVVLLMVMGDGGEDGGNESMQGMCTVNPYRSHDIPLAILQTNQDNHRQ